MERTRQLRLLQLIPPRGGKQWRMAVLLSYALVLQAWIGAFTHALHVAEAGAAYCVTSDGSGRSGLATGHQKQLPAHDLSSLCCVLGCATGGSGPAIAVDGGQTFIPQATAQHSSRDVERITWRERIFVGLARGPPEA